MRTPDGRTDIELTVSLRRADGRDWDLARATVPVDLGDATTLEGELAALRGLAARAVDALAPDYALDRAAAGEDRDARDAARDARDALRDADAPAALAELRGVAADLLALADAGLTHRLIWRAWSEPGARRAERFPAVTERVLTKLVERLYHAEDQGVKPALYKGNRDDRPAWCPGGTTFARPDEPMEWLEPEGRWRVTSEAAKRLARAEEGDGGAGRRARLASDLAPSGLPLVEYLARRGQVAQGLAMQGGALRELGDPSLPPDAAQVEAELREVGRQLGQDSTKVG